MFLSKRSNGYWYVIFLNREGKRNAVSTKTKIKRDALKYFSNFQAELEYRKLGKLPPIKLKDYIFQFIKYSEKVYTEKTVKAFKTSRKFLIEYFQDIFLSELTKSKISLYLDNRVKTSSIFAARKDLINLSSFCNKAIQDGYILHNPCKGIKQYKLPEKQPIFLSEEEYEALLCNINNEVIKDLVILAVNTGIRQMELITLEWRQVNFGDNLLILDNRTHVTKSKKIRSVPLNSLALQVLIKRKQNKIGEYVFSKSGGKLKQQYVSKTFKDFIIKSGLNDKLNFHSLRHTFASWLVQRGVSIYEVSKLLGHSDIKTTEIYSHLKPENLRNAVDLLV